MAKNPVLGEAGVVAGAVEFADRQGMVLVTVRGLTPQGDRNVMMSWEEARNAFPEAWGATFPQAGD